MTRRRGIACTEGHELKIFELRETASATTSVQNTCRIQMISTGRDIEVLQAWQFGVGKRVPRVLKDRVLALVFEGDIDETMDTE